MPHRDGESPFPDEQQPAPPQYNTSRRGCVSAHVAPPAWRDYGGQRALLAVGGKKLLFHDSGLFADLPKKRFLFDLKNGISDMLQFAESIVDFHLNFNHLA
jgi:hypothetical protein